MFNSMKAMTVVAIGLWASACAMGGNPGTYVDIDDKEQKKNEIVKKKKQQLEQTVLELTYISGHLGSSSGCANVAKPNKQGNAAGESSEAPSAAAAADMGGAPCNDDEDCKGFTWHCDNAVVTLRVRNIGNLDAKGLEVTDLELITQTGELVEARDVISVEQSDNNEFTGDLKIGETVDIRVEFASGMPTNLSGPAQFSSKFKTLLKVILLSSDGSTAELITPALHFLPEIAT